MIEIKNRTLKIHRFRDHGIWSQANNHSRKHKPSSPPLGLKLNAKHVWIVVLPVRYSGVLQNEKHFFKWKMASIFSYEYLEKAQFIYDNPNKYNRTTGKRHIYEFLLSLKELLKKKANKTLRMRMKISHCAMIR